MKKPMQKRIVTILAAAVFAIGADMAAAQSRGGGGGGGMRGGGMGGGGMSGMQGGGHGGGSWNGGGGGSWNGGGWHGGGNWNGGWRGGSWHGNGWHGNNVGFFFGFPGVWWPGYYPYWGWGGGYYNYASYPYPYYGDAAVYGDPGQVVYIQRDQVADGAYAPAPPAPAARSMPTGQFSYYCINPPGYYPQVPQCTQEWLKVVPNGATRPTPIPQYQ
jgi:hypothetical protein